MRTMEEIYEGMARRLEERTGAAVVDGGDMALRLWAVAAEIYTLEVQAAFVARQSFPQTASGAYLDKHAQVRGLRRTAAEKARGSIRFSLDEARSGEVTVPAGTVCLSGSERQFVTLEEGRIAPGELQCQVTAEAAEAGAGGNIPAGSIRYMVLAPAGVSAAMNPEPFQGGCDEETDEELRSRVLGSYRTLPNGANSAYYRSRVLGMDGVAAVSVLPKQRGLGTVDICVAADGGIPEEAKLEQVRTLLESEREICVDIQVSAPTAVNVDVSAELTLQDGAGFETVREAAEAAVRDCFGGKALGRDLYRAKLLAALMAVEGVENCRLTAPAADVAVGATELPVLGTLSVSEAV